MSANAESHLKQPASASIQKLTADHKKDLQYFFNYCRSNQKVTKMYLKH